MFRMVVGWREAIGLLPRIGLPDAIGAVGVSAITAEHG